MPVSPDHFFTDTSNHSAKRADGPGLGLGAGDLQEEAAVPMGTPDEQATGQKEEEMHASQAEEVQPQKIIQAPSAPSREEINEHEAAGHAQYRSCVLSV